MGRARDLVLGVLALASLAAEADAEAPRGARSAAPAVRKPRQGCGVVEVVYPDGRPVSGADVSHYYGDPDGLEGMSGQAWTTGRDGRVCEERLLDSGYLEVQAPAPLGGWCAADERLPYLTGPMPRDGDPVTRVVLHMRWLRRVRLRGRVVSAAGEPVAGAIVAAQMIFPDGTECNEGPELGGTATAADGTFRLPPLPRGGVEVVIEKPGYGKRIVRLESKAAPRDLVIDRGAEWIGRVLDPEGKPLEACHVELRTERYTGVSLESGCSQRGFTFHDIPPGDLLLKVRASAQAPSSLAPSRVLRSTIHFARNEHRAEDIRWPTGLDLAGQVVDADGRPIAAAWLRVFSEDIDKSSAEGAIELRANNDGTFALHHLEPGKWVVIGGRTSISEARVVVEAGRRDVRLVDSAPR